MIVDCHSCGATYNISDEKVRGRRVRVRCKSCSAAIIVDGETLVAEDRTRVYQPPRFDPKTEEDEPEEATRVMFASVHEYREPGPEEWMVNLSPTEQRTMSLDDIVQARNTGALKEDAFAWRDGMSDWLPIGEIAEIRAALESGEATKVVSPKNLSPALAPRGTLNGAAPGLESFRKSSSPTLPSTQIPSPPPLAPSSDSPAPAVAYSAPSAPPRAQRANEEPRKSVEYSPGSPPGVSLARLPTSPSRRAPARVREARSGDLFGGVDSAGSEDELLRSSSMPLEQYDEKPTGVRNESSVLFSLNTLKATARGPSSAPPKATLTSQPTAADILGLDASGALPGTDRNAPLYSAPMFQTPAAVLAAPEAPYRSRIDTTPPAFRSRKNAVLAAIVLGAAGIVAVFSIFFFRARYAHTAADADPGAPTVQAEAPTATPAPKPVAPDPAPMPPAAAA
ncbi:MAG TPA: zinc-ribbon domain-containing protein, partial [Polyangiaceae bacterium]|nr:zinc-ribbon domain-containing protein [Polyangiaceae bacterium]